MCKVVGVFYDEEKAGQAARALREVGFDGKISLIAKDRHHHGGADYAEAAHGANDNNLGTAPFSGVDSVTDGTATGGFIGGLAGLAVGAGTLFLPGFGAIAAMGPLAGMLSGAITGGLTGALVDFGIPETEGREYEHDLQSGATLAIIGADQSKTDEVARVLRSAGATDVKVYLEHNRQ